MENTNQIGMLKDFFPLTNISFILFKLGKSF